MDYSVFEALEFRRRFFKLVGAEITVVNPATDTLVGFISMKAWTLREDVRLYTDRSKTEEIFRIKARTIIDFGATYDVFGSGSDQARFNLRRKGLRSTFVRDHWLINGPDDKPLGEVIETSGALALFRRWVGLVPFVGEIIDIVLAFAPQSYRLTNAEGKLLATILRRKNPFLVKLELSTAGAEAKAADYFMGPAMCALLSIVDRDK